MASSRMDDEDIDLIIKLLQEDCQVAMDAAQGKGKQPEGAETDQQLAFQLLLKELQNAETVAMDRRMTRSIQQAIQADSDALARLRDDERQAQSDRDISIALSNGQVVPAAAPPHDAPQTSGEEDDFLDKLSCIYITGIEDEVDTDSGDDGEETAMTGWKQRSESSAWPRLDACGDRKHFAEFARAPCGHEYCRGCLGRLFEDAMVDETLFPPRCCKQPILLHQNLVFLDADVARRFRSKAVEFSTPNRTYCHDRRCGAFVPPSRYVHDAEDGGSVAATARCGECGARTCTACKGAAHVGDCPHDVQLQQVIRLAREQGWQRCQNCWGMVELNMGCNHMTCRCGFQFCYVCGSRWKTCECEQWDERRLLERAEQIDARDHGRDRDRDDEDAAAAAPREEVVMPAEPTVARRQEAVMPAEPMAARGQGAVMPAEPTVVRREEVVVPAEPTAVRREVARLVQEGPGRQYEAEREARLETLMQHLVANHQCEHELWRGRRGPRACEECGDEMPLFIYECRQCHIMACRRCRYHRL
ncbi:hypothetical protein DL765_005807 [Monosporascus sp. GIB2]|nr:hypothetical protein DL765_005807 [Monosporascus sp. GIB2]